MSEQREAIVVGGGQAGLAIGYHLARQGRDFTILEAGSEPTAAWRERWDSLRLFTSARYDALPGLAFPGDPDRYPTRDEVADYLTDYARRFELPVELNSRVHAVCGGDVVQLYSTEYRSPDSLPTRRVLVGSTPRRIRKRHGESPGLYFLGLSWQHTRGSALLGWVKDDAEYIAERIESLRPATAGERALTAN